MTDDRKRRLTSFERKLMRAMGYKNVRQLDKAMQEPVSPEAESHSEIPDEALELAERMYEEADRQRSAQREFNALFEGRYVN